jgi:hypothetical protein
MLISHANEIFKFETFKAKIFPKMFFNLCLQFQILVPNFQCNFIQKNEV